MMESIGDYRLDPPADPPEPDRDEAAEEWVEVDISTLLDLVDPDPRRGRFHVQSWNLLDVKMADGAVQLLVVPDEMEYSE